MNKVALVIDNPKNCAECKVVDYRSRVQEYHCRYLENRYMKKYDEKPDDCPLIPIPEKRDEHVKLNNWELEGIINSENRGYNNALDDILGETE